MSENEYKFIEKYLTPDDILLEWGSGNSTIYFSGMVQKIISIEHDVDYYYLVKNTIRSFDIKNVELYHVPPVKGEDREKQLYNYINFPVDNNMVFTKVLIDGRGRKYCATKIVDYITDDTIVFIHDFNSSDVEGYQDDNYFNDILNVYDIIERDHNNQGIVSLKKKKKDE
jgi:hypothetical protein